MLLVGMSWCKCTFVGMQWCRCPLMGMPWCECPFVSMQWRECPPVGISWHKCFDVNTLYSKIPFIFKTRLPQHLKPKCFQNLIYYSWKVIFFFYLRLQKKNWWSLLEISEWGIDLESDDLAQKIYFHNLVEQKGWHVSKAFFFFCKNDFLENKAS